jgi:hypothetical protein
VAGSLAERLQLIVEATDNGADTVFRRLSGSAKDADTAARKTGTSISAAADRVAQARAKEADAAGAVRVAETRLNELREKGTASGSQLARAEVAVEKARRGQHLATRELTQATDEQVQANADVIRTQAEAGAASRRMNIDLKGLAATAGGLVGGISLADWATDAVSGFIGGARGAQAMATSMNATVEQAGAFLGLVGAVGLELDDLIEIQAEFAGKTKDGLTQLGTELQHNADGTVNWTSTLVDTLSELQKIPDATERNRLGFSMFGEEGYKQLSRLLNSGVDVKEALEAIGTPFTEDDVALSREYDAAMLEFSMTSGELARTLGRAVVPAITGLVDAGQTLADVIGAVPGPIAAAALASIALGVAQRRTTLEGGLLAGSLARVTATAGGYTAAAGRAIAANGLLGASFAGARGAASGMMALAGGPLGVALIGAGTAYYFVQEGAEAFAESTAEAARESEAARKKYGDMAASSRELGRQLVDEAGYWEQVAAARNSTAADVVDDSTFLGDPLGFGSLANGFGESEVAAEGFSKGIDEASEALGEFGAQGETAQLATRGLKDLIAEGTTEGREFADAITAAAEAQAAETRTSDLATAAIDAYRAVTDGAVQSTLDLYNAQLGQNDALIGMQQAVHEAKGTVDDLATPWNEVDEATNRVIGSVLNYAGTVADSYVASARANGEIVNEMREAQLRAQGTIDALRGSLDQPGLTDAARQQITDLITDLETAKAQGDIEAILTLTGADEAKGKLDETTGDRETTIAVESRGGPAVNAYLDGLADVARFALIRVESRGGPAVKAYLEGLADARRLALIRVESRGGPAVGNYLDGLAAKDRLAIIRVETRGGPAVDAYLDQLANTRTAVIEARGAGAGSVGSGAPAHYGAPTLASAMGGHAVALRTVELDLKLVGELDRRQVASAERGRAHVADIRAYERHNGDDWRKR